jgi:hypothetical protein
VDAFNGSTEPAINGESAKYKAENLSYVSLSILSWMEAECFAKPFNVVVAASACPVPAHGVTRHTAHPMCSGRSSKIIQGFVLLCGG